MRSAHGESPKNDRQRGGGRGRAGSLSPALYRLCLQSEHCQVDTLTARLVASEGTLAKKDLVLSCLDQVHPSKSHNCHDKPNSQITSLLTIGCSHAVANEKHVSLGTKLRSRGGAS